MNAFTNYLEKLGSNFIVSAMVPSLALVVVSILVFDPILNIGTTMRDPQGVYELVGFGPIIFIATVMIGFTLTSLNTYILKMFEGYVIPFPIRFLYNIRKKAHLQKAHNMMAHRDSLENEVLRLEKYLERTPELKEEMEQLREEHYKAASDYDLIYPQDPADILPTRFGNTLKAAENYTGERYGFDGVHFWPRLVQVIPAEYKSSIDAVRNELSFLVNMSVLSAVFSLLCVFAVFYCMWITTVVPSDSTVFLRFLNKALPYFIALVAGLISSVFFYNASLFSVGSFGLMIRSSFDLFRMDLLKKLGLNRPKNSIEEYNTWQSLNELIVLGSRSLTFKKIDYSKEE
jgi:hypothetical protein